MGGGSTKQKLEFFLDDPGREIRALKGENLNLQMQIRELKTLLQVERAKKQFPDTEVATLWLSEIFSAIADKAVKLFFRRMVTEHVETILFQEEVTVRGEVFRVQLEKVGDREHLQQEVLAWLADPNHPTRPPLYKDRPKDANGKRMNEIEFFYEHYGRFSEAKAIYLDQLRKLDELLSNLIGQAWAKHQIPVHELVQPKSERTNETLLAMLNKCSPSERKLLEVMAGSSYRRDFT